MIERVREKKRVDKKERIREKEKKYQIFKINFR